jgi:hypothetical protein
MHSDYTDDDKQQFILAIKNSGIRAIVLFKEVDRTRYMSFLDSLVTLGLLRVAEENDDLRFYVVQ